MAVRLVKEEIIRDLGRLWGAAQIRPERLAEVSAVERNISVGRSRYESVAAIIGCPWWLIGIVHGLECSWSFAKHLHNGDALGAPTYRVPANRPLGWSSLPMQERTWERSAEDALRRLGWDTVKAWTIPETLYRLESYNGMGYRMYHPDVPSPYLWAATTAYIKGKYIEEKRGNKWVSVWMPLLVSSQVGSAAVIKRLVARGIAFPGISNATAPQEPITATSPISTYRRGADVRLSSNFHLREFECHCRRCGETKVSQVHVTRLQMLRNRIKAAITINSGYRCVKHNAEVGGVTGDDGGNVSQHVLGTATDIKSVGWTPERLAVEAEAVGFDGIGIYRTFVHVDSRGERARWRG